MTVDIQAKLQAVAQIIEGRVVDDDSRVAVSVKGTVFGFPASLEAVNTGWPFGVMYFLETEIVEDPNRPAKDDIMKMTICPRQGRGLMGFFTRILLFEAKGMSVGDKNMESKFIFSHDDPAIAERLIKYPGVADNLTKLEHYSKFSEMTIKTDAGIFLAQPSSFAALDLDVCRETFRILGELGQVLFEAF